jgi:hypothetical protein
MIASMDNRRRFRFRAGLAAAAAAAAALLPSLAASPALATSIGRAPEHRVELGCRAIRQVVANLNSGDLDEGVPFPGPTFYTDALGEVQPAEEEAFLRAMRHSDGKKDRKPIRLDGVYKVRGDEFRPTYLVVLVRELWRLKRYEMDGMLETVEIDDPHWDSDRSVWLVTFSSNHVDEWRETPELYPFAEEEGEVRACRTGGTPPGAR